MITLKNENNTITLTNRLIPLISLKLFELTVNKEGIHEKSFFISSHRLWKSIKEVRVFSSSGLIIIDFNDREKSCSIYTKALFDGIKEEIYQQFINELKTFVQNNSFSKIVFFKSGVTDPDKLDSFEYSLESSCVFCENSMKWPDISSDPYLVECSVCHKKHLQTYCKKCKIGGIVFPEEIRKDVEVRNDNIGTVADFATKPEFWLCNSCKTKWPINPDIYKNPPIMSQSSIDIKEQEKIKESISKNPTFFLMANAVKPPNLLIIFLIGFVSQIISQITGNIAIVLFLFWVFAGGFKWKTIYKIGGVFILGSLLGGMFQIF